MSKSMLITTHQKLKTLPKDHMNISLDGTQLQHVKSDKLLGVKTDQHLSWEDHVLTIVSSISRNIALLRRIRNFLPTKVRITFYKAFIQPHLDYCNTIWGHFPSVKRIKILQKLALRIILDVPRMTPSASLFKQCKVMTIHQGFSSEQQFTRLYTISHLVTSVTCLCHYQIFLPGQQDLVAKGIYYTYLKPA